MSVRMPRMQLLGWIGLGMARGAPDRHPARSGNDTPFWLIALVVMGYGSVAIKQKRHLASRVRPSVAAGRDGGDLCSVQPALAFSSAVFGPADLRPDRLDAPPRPFFAVAACVLASEVWQLPRDTPPPPPVPGVPS